MFNFNDNNNHTFHIVVTSLVSRISDLESRISTMKLSNDPHDVVGEKSDSEPDLFGSDSEVCN